jgi:hypothetical protein
VRERDIKKYPKEQLMYNQERALRIVAWLMCSSSIILFSINFFLVKDLKSQRDRSINIAKKSVKLYGSCVDDMIKLGVELERHRNGKR